MALKWNFAIRLLAKRMANKPLDKNQWLQQIGFTAGIGAYNCDDFRQACAYIVKADRMSVRDVTGDLE